MSRAVIVSIYIHYTYKYGGRHLIKKEVSDDFARPTFVGVECNEYETYIFLFIMFYEYTYFWFM